MATNIKRPGPNVSLTLPVPALTASGDIVEVSDLHGIALVDIDANGNAVVRTPIAFTADLLVTAKVNAGDSAVAIGNKLYYDAGETPDEVNKDVTAGKFIGYALGAITAGAAAIIEVGLVGG
jgi:predicted RecA/RadA family phage recombinase